MGRFQAEEMAALAPNIDVALIWHLQSNHYPPVHQAFLGAAKEAIEAAREEDWDRQIELPNGNILSATEVVDGLHLDSFIDYVEPEFYEDDGL